MAQAITNKKSKIKKIRRSDYPYTVAQAAANGDIATRISFLILGFGSIVRKQFVKGFSYLVLEVLFIWFMIKHGASLLVDIFHLGGQEQQKVWNDAKGVFEYTQGDNSLLMLLYGVATLFIIFAFICLWVVSIESAYKAYCLWDKGKKVPKFKDDVKSLFDSNLHAFLLPLPVLGVVVFTILPLVFMIFMAFTNYSKLDSHTVIFDWVGLKNFAKILNFSDAIGSTFWSVLGWTLVWAVAATFSNYFLGMILAMVINRKGTRAKSMWRAIFMLSAAVPQFVSLLIIRSMLAQDGIINVVLKNAGWISKSLPFFTNATWARMTVIIVNLWIGIPYTILQVTGILQNIPMELYEAADVDGANGFVKFFKITMPYMLFVTTPYLITTFTANVNNFNIVYLLTKGDPVLAGHTAGKTDLLVTWLYKMTVDYQYYNLGAVIGIMTFVFLALGSLLVYRRTKSYKDEEGFQ